MRAKDYREKALSMLSGKWGMAVLVTLVAGLLGGLLINAFVEFNVNLDAETIRKIPEFALTYLKFAAGIGSFLGLVTFVIGGTVKLGYCKYLLKLHDGEEGELKDLFSEFDRFTDGFLLSLLSAIYVFLWTMLFVIPGIVAVFKYAMAPFILLERPGLSPNDAITASKEMMDGHKAELFILDLSFIGWMLLNVATLGIGSLWLNPYMNAARAAFYRDIGYSRPIPAATGTEPQEPANPWDNF